MCEHQMNKKKTGISMLPILLVKLMMKIRYIYYMAELVRDKKEKSDWFAQESDFFNTDRL